MADELTLRVITPDRIVLDAAASAIRVPASDGSLGILRGHAPMVAALDVGPMMYRHAGKEHVLFVSGGFLEVRKNTVRVVSEAGERPEDIDEQRAAEAEKRARERLDRARRAGKPDIDFLRAELALRRARTRLQVKHYPHSLA
jgi:F-type H+-transporting ATPase subunit epsilon